MKVSVDVEVITYYKDYGSWEYRIIILGFKDGKFVIADDMYRSNIITEDSKHYGKFVIADDMYRSNIITEDSKHYDMLLKYNTIEEAYYTFIERLDYCRYGENTKK